VNSIAEYVTAYLNRPGALPRRQHFDLRDSLWFPVTTTSAELPTTPLIGLKTWNAGGYSVWRQRPSNPVVLVFDHGPLGYLSIAAHGHADALSVWLSVGDTPIIVDAGTYVYSSDPVWRERLRNSLVHNTLSISGVSSSSTSGPFNWAKKATARLVSDESRNATEVVAEHNGYLEKFGVRHRRRMSMSDAGKVTITDELIGRSDPLPVQISFLINPELSARIDCGRNSIVVEDDGRSIARFDYQGTLEPHIAFGDRDTGRGWVSPSFGKLNAAHQIVFEGLLSQASTVEITPLDQ
jgi:uncharacterized heparinase superfamily protein